MNGVLFALFHFMDGSIVLLPVFAVEDKGLHFTYNH